MHQQHRMLEDLCRQLDEWSSAPERDEPLLFLFDEVTRTLGESFRRQEAYMEKIEYPHSLTHRWQHAVRVGKTVSMAVDYRRGKNSFSEAVREIRALVIDHIQGPDSQLLRSCGPE